MHRVISLAFVLALASFLGGCVTKDGGDEGTPTAPTTATNATLPAPISDSKEVTGGADPLNTAMQPPCSTPQNQCQRYPFVLNATATIAASLTWTLPSNDFDLYLFQGADVVVSSTQGTPTPTTEEHFETDLEAGEYELVVVPWGVSRDTYALEATFA